MVSKSGANRALDALHGGTLVNCVAGARNEPVQCAELWCGVHCSESCDICCGLNVQVYRRAWPVPLILCAS